MDLKELHVREFEYETSESTTTTRLVPYSIAISIQIAELCDADYGYYIWPSSQIMADFIYNNRQTIFNSPDSNILELGSGTSLPSIVARKIADLNQVIITDLFDTTPKLLELAKFTMDLNEIDYHQTSSQCDESGIRIQHLNWTEYRYEILESLPRIDIIIGSDVFFDGKLFEALVLNVAYLVEFNNPNLVFYTTFHLRSSSKFIKLAYLLEKHGFTIEQLDFENDTSKEIYLLKISREKMKK